MTFEEKLKRLEEIVAMLESDQYGVESTLELFKEGMNLVKECKKPSAEIELKVEKVIESTDENIKTEQTDEF